MYCSITIFRALDKDSFPDFLLHCRRYHDIILARFDIMIIHTLVIDDLCVGVAVWLWLCVCVCGVSCADVLPRMSAVSWYGYIHTCMGTVQGWREGVHPDLVAGRLARGLRHVDVFAREHGQAGRRRQQQRVSGTD